MSVRMAAADSPVTAGISVADTGGGRVGKQTVWLSSVMVFFRLVVLGGGDLEQETMIITLYQDMFNPKQIKEKFRPFVLRHVFYGDFK